MARDNQTESMKMVNCQLCKEATACWAWQPFGPSADVASMTTLGSHYRGFAVIKVCNGCRLKIVSGELDEAFMHKANHYVLSGGKVYESPF